MNIRFARPGVRSWLKSPADFIGRLSPEQLFGLMFVLGLIIGIPLAAAINWYSLSH